MSFQTSSHFDSTTLLIVKTEIDNTIKNVEQTVTRLIEDGRLPFGIEDAHISLEQCAHVLQLVDQIYVARLTGLSAQLMQKIINDSQAQGIQKTDLEVMSEATNIIKRYLDFLCVRETRAPQFLIPTINKLEIALKQPLTREGVFLVSFLETMQPSVNLPKPEHLPASQYVSRLYKLCLLRLLKDQATDLDFRAFSLCASYFSDAATNTTSERYWRYVHVALQQLENTILTEPRLRVLINIERQSAILLASPHQFSVSHTDYADIIAICLSQDLTLSHELRDQLSAHDEVLSDNQLEILSRQLYGPDLETIQAITGLLSTQINDVIAKIETSQHVHSAEVRQSIHSTLHESSNILDLINLNDAAQQLRHQAELIMTNDHLHQPEYADQLMGSLLFATNSLQILERNYTPSRLKFKLNNTQITLAKVEEAQQLICQESRLSLQKVSEQLIRYMQNDDRAELQLIPAILREVSGAMLFLDAEQGFITLKKTAQWIETHMIDYSKSPTLEQFKLLANAIVSAEFFFEQLYQQQPRIAKTLDIGRHSIDELEKAIA